ncbi:hypothetical protein DM49_2323 [Burkholderia mallei]|nr:hypothetical protein DO73_3118 [Burkholderia pseudomallei]KOS95684.1 hypothetical protein DM49_2323 [Burkholderia mallei]KOT06557.1 hypothetical protein DM77_1225 [Burkholderia mallei]
MRASASPPGSAAPGARANMPAGRSPASPACARGSDGAKRVAPCADAGDAANDSNADRAPSIARTIGSGVGQPASKNHSCAIARSVPPNVGTRSPAAAPAFAAFAAFTTFAAPPGAAPPRRAPTPPAPGRAAASTAGLRNANASGICADASPCRITTPVSAGPTNRMPRASSCSSTMRTTRSCASRSK